MLVPAAAARCAVRGARARLARPPEVAMEGSGQHRQGGHSAPEAGAEARCVTVLLAEAPGRPQPRREGASENFFRRERSAWVGRVDVCGSRGLAGCVDYQELFETADERKERTETVQKIGTRDPRSQAAAKSARRPARFQRGSSAVPARFPGRAVRRVA